MNKIRNSFKTLFPKIPNIIEWVLLGLIIIIIFLGIRFPHSRAASTSNSFLIDSVLTDTSSVVSIEESSRRQMLFKMVQEHYSYAEQNDVSQDSLRMQGRLFFITIFAVLITVIIPLKDKRSRINISIIVSLFGLFWYGISVHVIDIENRGQIPKRMLYNTESQLLAITHDNFHSYHLDFKKIETVIDDAKVGHFSRKVKSFFTPDPEQILFNLTPIGILLILRRLYKVKVKKSRLTRRSS
ncbi:MAG: hypothetical protein ABR936_15450 [Bacteroidota bacterium]|jgi:hypothetical protein